MPVRFFGRMTVRLVIRPVIRLAIRPTVRAAVRSACRNPKDMVRTWFKDFTISNIFFLTFLTSDN